MAEIVPKNLKLRKETAQKLVMPVVVVLVGIGAFGLGRLSALQEGRGHLIIHAPDMPAAVAQSVPYVPSAGVSNTTGQSASEHAFVASKNGSKYYSSGCPNASRIKPENQVWFATAAEAQAAGYTVSTTCK